MNELKIMAFKAKSRLLNRGLREMYFTVNKSENHNKINKKDDNVSCPPFNDYERKKLILQNIKNKLN